MVENLHERVARLTTLSALDYLCPQCCLDIVVFFVRVSGLMVIEVTGAGNRVIVGSASCVVVVSVVYHNLIGALVNLEGLGVSSVVFVCHDIFCFGFTRRI